MKKIFKILDNFSKTVLKAIDILEVFLKADGVLSLNEISTVTGLNVATTYRIIYTRAKPGK